MQKDYDPLAIEPKWRSYWEKNKTFQVDLKGDLAKGRSSPGRKNPSFAKASKGKPYYNLMMFPYPSAEGLHIGNVYAFTGSDIWGRYMQMKGFAVFEPIGLDGFGIHSENYAIKVGKHPSEQAKVSEANFYRQLKSIGNMFSWDNKLETYDPDYYKWTQWIFVQLFKAGLAYRAKAKVNWCPSCKTVLADELVINGLCERCSNKVEDRDLEQWFFRITDYADRLLENTKKIDWSEKVLTAQRNWIGKSEGLMEKWQVEGLDLFLETFTTWPHTTFGATFMVIAPQHPVIDKLVKGTAYEAGAKKFIAEVKQDRIKDSKAAEKIKKGYFLGRYVINHLTNRKMPLYIANFAIMEYGTGIVKCTPTHDQRDFEFAKKYGLPMILVVTPKGKKLDVSKMQEAYTGPGIMTENTEKFSGMPDDEARKAVAEHSLKLGHARKVILYHLRDWLISRQRYWGPPIPMVYCKSCAEKGISWFNAPQFAQEKENLESRIQNLELIGNWKLEIGNSSDKMAGWYPISEVDLPVVLPDVKDWRPKGTGRGPLAQLKDWVKTTCPKCDGPAERETDVSDTFLDSAWYHLRYPSVNLKPGQTRSSGGPQGALATKGQTGFLPWNKIITSKWLPVDMYIGGAEHSVLHLLYSRFLTMVFKDLKLLDFEEPFTKFRCHGLIIKDSAKMSKSKGNIVNPDKYIAKHGADALRCYLMFLGPLADGGDFRDTGMVGMYKFLSRVYKLVGSKIYDLRSKNNPKDHTSYIVDHRSELFWIHKTIKRVTEGIEKLKYNTSLAAIMEFINYLSAKCKPSSRAQVERVQNAKLSLDSIKTLILLLAPFAPHLTEELWQTCKDRVFTSKITGGKSYVKTGSLHPFGSIHHQPWPTYDPKFIKEKTAIIVVQVNGKVRDRVEVDSARANFSSAQDKEKVLALAKKSLKVQAFLKSKQIKKTIFVKGKLINLVV